MSITADYFITLKFIIDILHYYSQGDSGSPFVCKNEQRIWTQIGIVQSSLIKRNTTGEGCTNTLTTKVDQYLKFIQNGNT